MNLKNSTFIDLFAGIGGFHQALSHFGAKCVFASEIDKYARQTYFDNYGLTPFGDITQINAEDIPVHDILCAGFPCQAFSISGKQKGFDDVRGTLFFDIVRIVKYHTPKIILLENVKNLAKHDNGNTLTIILSHLNELGYKAYYQVLNASHFGIAQNRERIYIVAFHHSVNHQTFLFPKGNNIPVCVADILEDNPNIEPIQRDDVVFKNLYQTNFDHQGNKILPNTPIQIGIVGKGGQGERIYHTDGHAITLSAHGGGIGSKTGLYQVNEQIRKLTPRECARLQGFPESFNINPSNSQAYKQFGNSVAIPVLKEILQQIQGCLMTNNFNEKQQLGSITAKGGFENETSVVDNFNNYQIDQDVQYWLSLMGYSHQTIQTLQAIQIPTRLNKKNMANFGISQEQFEFTQKYKKADIQIQLTIMVDDVVYRENISLKKADLSANFNQIDKRAVNTYQEMWGFDDNIATTLKKFTGEIVPTEQEKTALKDKKRWYLTELPNRDVQALLDFLTTNKYLIISDVIKGRGMLCAEWFLVSRFNNDGTIDYCLKNINEVINFYAQGNVKVSSKGSLIIGRLTAQRKGGTPDPTSLQFKIKPLDIFDLS